MKNYILNTFTSSKAKGNPTPVIIYDEPMSIERMHAIAIDLCMPVAAFVSEQKHDHHYRIQYFSATGEIPACGHATLAAAQVVHEQTGESAIAFLTEAKVCIGAMVENDVVYLSYPKYTWENANVSSAMKAALRLHSYQHAFVCDALETLFIELNDADALRNVSPDFKAMVAADDTIKEVVITSVSDEEDYDFLLRSFCPWIGIDEDPVTGSVHSVLAHYWSDRTGKQHMKAYQASELGGDVFVHALNGRVELGGRTERVGGFSLMVAG